MTWREAPPPPPTRPGPAGWLLLGLRAPAAFLWLGAMFAVFLLLCGLDRLAAAILLRPLPALAPWAVRAWAFGALKLLGLRFRWQGTPMRGPGAMVANHSSWLDVVALMRVAPVRFVSKAEVEGWPGIGFIARAIGTVFIERRAVEAGRQTATLHERLLRGDRFVLFPEGTSTDGRQVIGFKSALFGVFFAPDLCALEVQPVSISYRPPASLSPDFYGWWGDMDFGAHLIAVLAASHGGEVEVRFYRPLRAANFTDRKALAEAACAAVRAGHHAAASRAAANHVGSGAAR